MANNQQFSTVMKYNDFLPCPSDAHQSTDSLPAFFWKTIQTEMWSPLSLSGSRFGSRTGGPSAGNSSRVAAVPRPGRPRRSHRPHERARAPRAAASLPRRRCPAPAPRPAPTRPQAAVVAAERAPTRASAAHLPPSARSPPSGARPSRQARHRLPRSPWPSPWPRPTPPACSAPSPARQAPLTPCPTTSQPVTARATRPHPAPTSVGWTVAPTWPLCTLTTTHTNSAPWRPPPCPDTLTTTSANPQGITITITTTTRPTVVQDWPSTPLTAWITKNKPRPRGNSTSMPQTVWTTKTRLPGDSKSCDFSFSFFLPRHSSCAPFFSPLVFHSVLF